jgi:diadenylate cyclase
LIGKNRVVLGNQNTFRSLLPWNWRNTYSSDINFEELSLACKFLSRSLTGALIVLARSSELKFFTSTGIYIDGDMSSKLLESIFNKKSPLHDGAVIMVKNKVRAASCILPVSEASNLPLEFGLRHRSALGIAEQTDAMAIVVSEETGRISIASKGQISKDLSTDEDLSKRFFREYFELD